MTMLQSTLAQRVRDLVHDRPWRTPFTGTINSSVTTVPVPDGTRWDEGAVLEFQDQGERIWIRSVSSNNLTVLRGQDGTTAAAHDGSVTAIIVNRDPLFEYTRVIDSISATINELWPYAYQKKTATLNYSATTAWYDLAADYLGLISVTQVDSSSPPSRLYIYGSKGSRLPVGVKTNVPTSLCASGTGIIFPNGWAKTSGSPTIQVDYAALLTNTTSGSPASYSDFSDGLLAEVIAYGAASRLTMISDADKVTGDDNGMGDASIQPRMATMIGRDLWQNYRTKLRLYFMELQRTMPIMDVATGPKSSNQYGLPYFTNPPY